LANYISPYQTLIGQKTKNKIPNFQSRKNLNEKSTTIKYINGKPNINFNNNFSDFNYDLLNKQLSINLKKKKFVPVNVYKSLVKIGLSLCPITELKEYTKAIEWLAEKDNNEKIIYDIPLNLFRTRFANKYYEKPFATLYKRKSEIINNTYEPKLCLIVCSGVLVFNYLFHFVLKLKNKFRKYKLINEIYPAFLLNLDFKGKKKINIKPSELPLIKYNMNYYGQVEENELINFRYEEIEET